jgi:hypothetical protein
VDDAPMGEMVWIDRAGNVISQIGPSLPRLSAPRLSPDQRQVAFSAEANDNLDIWIRNLETGLQSRVTSESVDDREPTWFPDGRRLVYFESARGVATARVAARGPDGGTRVEIAAGEHATVSPNGKYLLYLIDDRGSRRLRMAPIAADGSIGPAVPFFKTTPEPVIISASVSPASNLLAYVEPHPGGRPELYLTRFPDAEGRWHLSSGGRVARWSRTGDLFYMEGTNQSEKRMMTVRVEWGATLKAGSPLKLFDMTDELGGWSTGTVAFDVKGDGSAFLMVRSRAPSGTGSARWILVENWAEEFPSLRR